MSKENKEAEDNLSEIKELKDQINQLTNEKDKYLDIAQRAQDDLVNYRKKSSIDLKESEERSQRRILHQIIMILDQINMALSAKVNTKTYKSWIEGIGSINKNLVTMLASFDLIEINLEKDDKFDPNIHEAISSLESDKLNDGEIVRQISPGYKHKDYLLRPILVEIAINKK